MDFHLNYCLGMKFVTFQKQTDARKSYYYLHYFTHITASRLMHDN